LVQTVVLGGADVKINIALGAMLQSCCSISHSAASAWPQNGPQPKCVGCGASPRVYRHPCSDAASEAHGLSLLG
jgi:hypothetical protein